MTAGTTYKLFVDESGTHRSTGKLVLAGYCGSALAWKRLRAALKKLYSLAGVEGVHAVDLKRGNGVFRGWRISERKAFLSNVESLTVKHLKFRFFISIDLDEYKNLYVGDRKQSKFRIESAYSLCVRGLLTMLPGHLERLSPGDRYRIDVVLERGQKNAAEAVKTFEAFRAAVNPSRLGVIRFGSKEDIEIQVADLMAFAGHSDQNSDEPTELEEISQAEFGHVEIADRTDCPLITLRITPETLTSFREQSIRAKELERLERGNAHVPRSPKQV